jgi:ribosomal protein S27AE
VARRRRQGRERPRRQKRELEAPGSVLKGPRITVNCECGETQYLAYGERWRCGNCGRSYDTNRIPQEQYEEIRQISLRFRMLPIAFGALVAAAAIVFTLTGNIPGVFFLLPVALVTWFVFIRPVHRKRYREAIKGLPVWQLRAE